MTSRALPTPRRRRGRSLLRGGRPWLLALLAALIIAQIVALSPSSLEDSRATRLRPEALIDNTPGLVTLATAVPKGQIPEYTVEAFNFASTQNGIKQWKITADKAFLFNKQRLVHTRQVVAHLFDSSGKVTTVTGDEAQYFMDKKDLEIFGHVETTLSDGFKVRSETMQYLPDRKLVHIPGTSPVHGEGNEADGHEIRFDSQGLDFHMEESRIELPKAVRFMLARTGKGLGKVREETWVDSDRCRIDRVRQNALFTMGARRPLADRFVKIRQTNLTGRGRSAFVSYGSESGLVDYLTLREDVFIRERSRPTSPLRYGTGGRADFDASQDVITFREFPQVYQGNDTVTGDIIRVHRDTDVVEVEHSNAFTDGETAKKQ